MTRGRQIATGVGVTLAGLAGMNALVRVRAGSLPETLHDGERLSYDWRYGRVSYQVAGDGAPLLLVHGVYAGACNYEWRRNFDVLSRSFRVFAPDLLGFGHSERPAIEYTDDLYVGLLHDFTRDVVGVGSYAVADSESCGFLVADAAANPDSYRSLVLVCPTAISSRDGHGLAGRLTGAVLRTPLVGTALYNAIVSRGSIEAELNKLYEQREAFDDHAVRLYYASSHQPGAKWAATAFLSGRLRRDIRGEFRSLQMPVLLVWGDEAAYTPVSNAAAFLAANPRADLKVFAECGSLPQEEHPERFNELLLERFHGGSVPAVGLALEAA